MRLIDVAPPSRSRESGLVLRAAIAIALATLFVISSRRQSTPRDELPLLPFQRSFADLPASLQRDYRELREGFAEAARVRGKSGEWPSPETLALEGVPPFANDGVDGRVRDWQLVSEGLARLYFGIPRPGVERESLLLQVLEPAPGDFEGRDPNAPIDEEHQRLADGTLVHVTTWFQDPIAAARPAAGAIRPEMSGWTQMVGRVPPRASGR